MPNGDLPVDDRVPFRLLTDSKPVFLAVRGVDVTCFLGLQPQPSP